MAKMYARLSEGQTYAEETALCEEHVATDAGRFRAQDAPGPHELCEVANSRLVCQVCGASQEGPLDAPYG